MQIVKGEVAEGCCWWRVVVVGETLLCVLFLAAEWMLVWPETRDDALLFTSLSSIVLSYSEQ